jgi:hypothetical protein
MGLILGPSLTAFYWINDGFRIHSLENTKWFFQFATVPFAPVNELPNHIKFLGFLTDLIPCSFFIATLLILMKLFRLYERLHFFTKKNVFYIRQIAFILVVSQLVHPFYVALHSYILSLPNPSGERIIFFAYGPHELKTLFLAFLLFLAAYIMEIGRYFYEEHSATI